MKNFFTLLISLMLIVILLTPFALAESKGGTIVIGVDQEVVGLDPHIVTAFSSFRRIDLLYNTLVKLDYNLNIVPDLADSWEIPDSLTYIFHLKKGVKFITEENLLLMM